MLNDLVILGRIYKTCTLDAQFKPGQLIWNVKNPNQMLFYSICCTAPFGIGTEALMALIDKTTHEQIDKGFAYSI